jgi:hypothetical protein
LWQNTSHIVHPAVIQETTIKNTGAQAEKVEVLKAVVRHFGALHGQWQINGVNPLWTTQAK